jgi:arsenite methyltransferase
MLMDSGFKVNRLFQESFEMKFLNGSALLNHHFIKFGWLTSWINIFPKEELMKFFSALEHNLNEDSQKSGCLILTVPMAFIEGEK